MHVVHTQAGSFLRLSSLCSPREGLKRLALIEHALLQLKWRDRNSNASPFSYNSSARVFVQRKGSRGRRDINKQGEAEEKMDIF